MHPVIQLLGKAAAVTVVVAGDASFRTDPAQPGQTLQHKRRSACTCRGNRGRGATRAATGHKDVKVAEWANPTQIQLHRLGIVRAEILIDTAHTAHACRGSPIVGDQAPRPRCIPHPIGDGGPQRLPDRHQAAGLHQVRGRRVRQVGTGAQHIQGIRTAAKRVERHTLPADRRCHRRSRIKSIRGKHEETIGREQLVRMPRQQPRLHFCTRESLHRGVGQVHVHRVLKAGIRVFAEFHGCRP